MMTGADSAHLEKVKAETARVIAFPDGVSRLMRLTALQWEAFDRWMEITSLTHDDLTAEALSMACDTRETVGSETFEEDVQYAFGRILHEFKTRCASVPLSAINENDCCSKQG